MSTFGKTMIIRRLLPPDVAICRRLRLRGLRDSPAAFGSSYSEEARRPLRSLASRLADSPTTWTFGALEGEILVGVLSMARDARRKKSHKAAVFGMYVERKMRRKGIGRQLLAQAIDTARSLRGVRQITLSVVDGNTPALHLYEGLGFKIYGTEKNSLLVSGRFHAEHLLALEL